MAESKDKTPEEPKRIRPGRRGGMDDAQGWDKAMPPPPIPLQEGHRDRLRARFMKGGADPLPDYELLELVLFRAIPRRDVKPLAKQLLNRFGDFAHVLSAEPERLKEIAGVGDTVVQELKIVRAAALRLVQQDVQKRPSLTSGRAVMDYLNAAMAHETVEQFRVLFLDRRNNLIQDIKMYEGTVDHAPVYPREVVKRALELGASALILVHNHPSGDPTPSRNDIEMTKEIMAAAATMGIVVHDHVIVGKGMHASLKSLGLM